LQTLGVAAGTDTSQKENIERIFATLNPEWYRENINLNAGLEFIQRFEANLLNLHSNNRCLAMKAESTDKKIVPVYSYVIQQQEAWNRFQKEIKIIPEINQNIEKIKVDLDSICGRIEQLEVLLSEQIESTNDKMVDNYKEFQASLTKRYRDQKQVEMDSLEQELRINSYRIEQQRIDLEKLKLQERINEQMIKAREKEREDKLKEQEMLLEQARMRQSIRETFKKEVDQYKARQSDPRPSRSGSRKKKKRSSKHSNYTTYTTPEQVDLTKNNDSALEDFLATASEDQKIEGEVEEEEENITQENNSLVMPSIESPFEERRASSEQVKSETDESPMSVLVCPPTPVSDQQEKTPTVPPAAQSYEDLKAQQDEEESKPAKPKNEPKEQEVVDVDESWY